MFAIDEKPQIQALNRTAPTLPMLPTTPQRATKRLDDVAGPASPRSSYQPAGPDVERELRAFAEAAGIEAR